MADATLAHLEVPLDPHVAGELPGEPAERCAGGVLGGLEVILRDRHTLGIPDLLGPHLLAHDLARGRDGEAVAHREADLGQDEAPTPHALAPDSASQHLLVHLTPHSYFILPPLSLNTPPTTSPPIP